MKIFNELFINFWIWWYLEAFAELIKKQRTYLRAVARITGLSVHSRYFLTPLYKDKSFLGLIISIFIRSGFILVGGSAQLLAISALAIFDLLYFIFPVLPLLKIWSSIFLK